MILDYGTQIVILFLQTLSSCFCIVVVVVDHVMIFKLYNDSQTRPTCAFPDLTCLASLRGQDRKLHVVWKGPKALDYNLVNLGWSNDNSRFLRH
jgi:hypothetical protein